MTVLHPACCGPQHATNVHRDCPRIFAGWGGEVLRCECGCHAGIAMQVRENDLLDRYTWGTNTDGPRRCANTVIQGPRRTSKEFD